MIAVARNARIEIKDVDDTEWTDISCSVTRWRVDASIGEPYAADLTLILDEDVQLPELNDEPIYVHGVKVWNRLTGYEIVRNARMQIVIILHFLCDEDVLRINGAHPWLEN